MIHGIFTKMSVWRPALPGGMEMLLGGASSAAADVTRALEQGIHVTIVRKILCKTQPLVFASQTSSDSQLPLSAQTTNLSTSHSNEQEYSKPTLHLST